MITMIFGLIILGFLIFISKSQHEYFKSCNVRYRDFNFREYTKEQYAKLLVSNFLIGTLVDSGEGYMEIFDNTYPCSYKMYHDLKNNKANPFYVFTPHKGIYIDKDIEVTVKDIKYFDKNGVCVSGNYENI